MKKIKLAVLPGDGIGQDVTLAAVPIFKALNISVEMIFGDIGWECWKQAGNPIPPSTWDIIKLADATLLGATTSMPEREAIKELSPDLKKSSPPYVSPIIQLRQQLDLFANVRPCFNIKGEGEDFNFTIIRENTEGLYAGLDYYPLTNELTSMINANPRWKHITNTNAACSLRLQSFDGLKRLFEFAFDHANQKEFNHVTFADKPNVLRKSSSFARDIFENVAKKYPHIKADIQNVDAVALWMVKRPDEFGVIVAENMFGDILSDLGAGIMGGLGFAPSANIGINGCYFEPVHGSAPRVKPNSANPSAMFLTIGLLLENFGYSIELKRIQYAIQQVIKEGRHTTYDLGGNASTQEIAEAIIDKCLHPTEKKRISFIATGTEIITGDIQDTNSCVFAKSISINGGDIYQHLQASDNKDEITSSLKHLLNKSEAVVVTGGLGPTSDDTTRYAISDALKTELYFDETAWAHVVERLERFNLPVTDSNRQQALFPKNAELYPNDNGTAFGCHVVWNQKHIFMLPGPPKECRPLFDKYVIPILEKNKFFIQKKIYCWLTLGLIEGEIAPQIDEAAKHYSIETAYRWNYPYLEIKLITKNNSGINKLIEKVENIIKPYIVSKDSQDAFSVLSESATKFSDDIYINDLVTNDQFSKLVTIRNLKFTDKLNRKTKFSFLIKSNIPLLNQSSYLGSIEFVCEGYFNSNKKYQHNLMIPNRGPEVMQYASHYIAWQLVKFIQFFEV